ncbi:hypothetical protein [Enterobacter quasiroggenkampii]|uniref:hypothetical protein n=1 Tax=Enterobacter quasiroggenkampii TaxID=2497436 RepID=UPI0021D32255
MLDKPDGGYVSHEDYAALEARCAALAAEMAWLKKFCKDAAFDADYEAELGMERGGFTDALNNIKTPATDAFLAEVRAQGVEMCSSEIQKQIWDEREGDGIAAAIDAMEIYASQLRKGVQS